MLVNNRGYTIELTRSVFWFPVPLLIVFKARNVMSRNQTLKTFFSSCFSYYCYIMRLVYQHLFWKIYDHISINQKYLRKTRWKIKVSSAVVFLSWKKIIHLTSYISQLSREFMIQMPIFLQIIFKVWNKISWNLQLSKKYFCLAIKKYFWKTR